MLFRDKLFIRMVSSYFEVELLSGLFDFEVRSEISNPGGRNSAGSPPWLMISLTILEEMKLCWGSVSRKIVSRSV